MLIVLLLWHTDAFASEDGCTSIPVDRAILDARPALTRGDWTAARAVLSTATEALLCTEEPYDARLLVDLYQLSGFTAWKEEDLEEACEWFARAVAADPGRELDPGLGVAAAQVYQGVRRDLLGQPRATLSTTATTWVDGQVLEREQQRELVPGAHLLQRKKAGELWTELRMVMPGEEIQFPSDEERGKKWVASVPTIAVGLGAVGGGIGLYTNLQSWLYQEGCWGTSTPDDVDICDAEVDVSIRGRQITSIALMAGGGALTAFGLWVGFGDVVLTAEPGGVHLSGRW